MEWLHTAEHLLHTRYVGRAVRTFESTDSTNARAMAWAEEGGPAGGLVIAEHQEAGRGRLGRRWEGGRGESLLLSVVLRPDVSESARGLLPLACGLAVVDAIEPFVRQPLSLKWPNDVLLGGLKCAGVLVEGVFSGEDKWAVAGIGINVNQERMPPPLDRSATSLRLSAGTVVPRPMLLAALLEALEDRLDVLESDAQALLEAYRDRVWGIGRVLSVTMGDGTSVAGRLVGIQATGALELDVEGSLRVFTAGDVSIGTARTVSP